MTETVQLRGQRALWRVEEPIPAELRAVFDGQSVMLSHLLYCRGYGTADEIQGFFLGTPVAHDPFLLPDMDEAVERIARAVRDGERVAVYGDFDCDGITSAAVLDATLRGFGLDPIVSIPTREDGHGMHPEVLARLADGGVTLVVTADCGVTSIEEVRVAQGMGMDVIVTDHHEARVDGMIPPCLVVAPTRHDASYPFRYLCGVGLAYKLAQALTARVPGGFDPDDLLDLVALGTIADVVPLRDENRTLVLRGMQRLRATQRPGLRALCAAASIAPEKINPTAIGFYLAPRINAANRMATPQLAYDLLTARDETLAVELARQLSEHNVERQVLVADYLETVARQIGEPSDIAREVQAGARPPVLIVIGDWPKGISGLLASKLVDAYGLPAFVGTDAGAGIVAVSVRSIPGVRVDEILERCESALPGGIFLNHGGHAGAGGFSVDRERLGVALGLLEDVTAREVPVDEIGAVLTIDAEVPLARMTLRAAQQVQSLEPFGMGFPEPLFLARNVTVRSVKALNGKPHVRARLAQDRAYRDAVWFNAPPEFLAIPRGALIDVVFHVQIDEWNGLARPELRLRDWRPADTY